MTSKSILYVLAGMIWLSIPSLAGAQMATEPNIHFGPHWGQHKVCDHDGDDCRWVPNAPAAHGEQYRICDADGDDCRWISNAPTGYHRQCDADGDRCHWTNGYGPQYWRNHGGHEYGAPYAWYQAPPPGEYNLVRQRNWLINRCDAANAVLQQARARGDEGAEERLNRELDVLNQQMAKINGRLANR